MSIASPPKYQRIKRRLIADIEAGVLPPGTRIPSETKLMQQHGVARMTVVRSLNDMVAEGYLVRMRGKGTFVRVHQPQEDHRSLAAFALVVPEVRDGYYPSLIKSFGDASDELNHQILTCNTNNEVEKQGNVILQLIDNHVAGVALLPATHGTPPIHHVRQLQSNRIPVVQLHRGLSGVSAPLLAMEYERIGQFAGRTLVAAGHRRVAYFATHLSSTSQDYATGLSQVLREVGSDLPDCLTSYGQRTGEYVSPEHEASIAAALRRMLQLPAALRPTAIFCSFDSEAELIYLTLEKFGLRIPSDISLVSVGAEWRHSAIARRLTCIAADEDFVGRTAVELLDEMASKRRPIDDQLRIPIPLRLYPGETVKEPISGEQ